MSITFSTGLRYGRLTVVEVLPREGSNRKAVCRCDCGNERLNYQANLVSGRTTSCGCYLSELVSERRTTHGEAGNAYHGIPSTAEYRAWKGLRERCTAPTNKRYQHYGARGITVCDEWTDSFATFLRDMGRRPSAKHSIDRIDNDGNYCKSNCRWATRIEQQSNTSRNRFVVLEGERMTITAAGRKLGLYYAATVKRFGALA